MFNGVVEKKGIRNETDLFKPIGNRRKWESLYDEITLDNVVKAMKKQSAKGGQGLFGGSIFGAAQSEFKNIDEIREAARERIRELSNEEIEGRRNEITDRLSQIDIPMRDKGIGGSFDMIENITDSVRHSHTAKGIYNYLHDIYPGMTMDIANEIADIVKDIQQMSARYFEAKPYRAVGFDEIKFAVVPDNTDVSLLNQLQSMKIPVETYEKGNNEQRKQVLNESSDKYDTRFRTIVVNPRYGSKIETVRTNHTSVYKAVDKYLLVYPVVYLFLCRLNVRLRFTVPVFGIINSLFYSIIYTNSRYGRFQFVKVNVIILTEYLLYLIFKLCITLLFKPFNPDFFQHLFKKSDPFLRILFYFMHFKFLDSIPGLRKIQLFRSIAVLKMIYKAIRTNTIYIAFVIVGMEINRIE